MGYYSDVRILIREKDFNKMCRAAQEKFPDYSMMSNIDFKCERIGKGEKDKEIKYIYFGWNCIKFYYEEAEWVESFVKRLKDFHFVRNWHSLERNPA